MYVSLYVQTALTFLVPTSSHTYLGQSTLLCSDLYLDYLSSRLKKSVVSLLGFCWSVSVKQLFQKCMVILSPNTVICAYSVVSGWMLQGFQSLYIALLVFLLPQTYHTMSYQEETGQDM